MVAMVVFAGGAVIDRSHAVLAGALSLTIVAAVSSPVLATRS